MLSLYSVLNCVGLKGLCAASAPWIAHSCTEYLHIASHGHMPQTIRRIIRRNMTAQSKPLKIKSSVSKSNPSRWHFLHSPVMVELNCRLQRDSMAGAGGKKCRLARSNISPLTLEPFRSTFFSFGNMRSGRLLLEM